ncbi:NAD-dependent epimerase/dehydratase family protein [Kaistella flava (ex Peng et al. 2021)]|uniref:NAD-dependent epimerase/dehydratase family protein n=1 Tax=Kaistella flava (ex Peng et al. 2021) TaxID=2038776 RepID=A0A7M2YD51_9FLAO|nr:NAD-dependent epimerase/dehydratase family protein [Kaistella flava (ex Peng et al. 2021)]QOW11729.1 NAD-dependent epimerase/dehydratase family protein [Kaistella flava (ex Peng et al. 2021)]
MVLVTGATGILGRVIVLELLKRGKSVRATKRASSNIEEVRESYRFYTDKADDFFNKIEWIDVDFQDLESLQNALDQVTEVYHCAAHVSFHPDERRTMYQTNIEGTRQLLFACEDSSVKKFCFVSSTAVLDGVNEKGETTEDSNYNSKLIHSPYAKSKHFSEMEVWRASAEGLNTVIINPGVIIGSGNWQSSSGEIFDAFEKYPYAMSGSTTYVDVRDVSEIAISLMENNIFGERFIIISETKKIIEVANFVREKLGKSKAKVLSKGILNLGYVFNVLFGWLFPKLRMMSKVNLETVTSNHVVSNKKIRKELDYQFIPVFESIDFHLKNYISDKK